ncbi:MAG: D-alanine--D-alanine ligase [Actinomycetota bacterium]|nr:D-alanine--D-alanine ligase [Actinomycetota bacterium]MDD5667162.1 D-alanine--D-alanine ligase [Actinomycetota bacterium]
MRIGVLMGGRSLERDISLRSGRRVSRALDMLGHEVLDLDVNENLVPVLRREHLDLVYIALHGKFGEDGTVQELLEILDIPYTGPGVFSSTIGFNKAVSKEIFLREGIPTPPFFVLSEATFHEMGALHALEAAGEKLGFPLVVKPAAQGSALGIRIAASNEEVPEAVRTALHYDDRVLLEKYVNGTEVAVSILGNDELKALPLVETVPQSGFFDFDSRYTPGLTEYYCPARLDEGVSRLVVEMALRAHRALGCLNVSRVDIIIDAEGVPQVLELNISPGMTETSLLPMAAEAAGMEFKELVRVLVRLAMEKYA